MIVPTKQLSGLAGRVAMVDGGFDPLHAGHVEYFRVARGLGAPLLCNIAPDAWVERKHPPLLAQRERGEIVDAIRHVDYVHLAQTSTADVLRTLRPRFYVKGPDWRDRLPAEELQVCEEHGVEIVYLDTAVDSSTAILERYLRRAGGTLAP